MHSSDPNSLNGKYIVHCTLYHLTITDGSAWSLWLEPEPPTQIILKEIIDRSANIVPASLSFAPHVTLYPSVKLSIPLEDIQKQITAGVSQMAEHSDIIRLRLQAPTHGNSYYQSVLSPVRPNGQLDALRQVCCRIWGDVPNFFPHLSLKYGEFEESRRQEIAAIISSGREMPSEIQIRQISIARCVGMSNEWTVVAKVPFQASR